jgi:Transposase DDE domain
MATSSPRMVLGEVFERFVAEGPICVLVRALLEKALNRQTVDALFEQHAQTQYTRELLFSSVVDVMSLVVCGMQPSVNAAYKHLQDRIPVARQNLYEKINHTEPAVSAALLRQSAGTLTALLEHLGGALPELLPGYRVRILDGNWLAATEHRIEELRTISAGPLPGKSLVVLDPALMLAVDVFPCADGHAQERALLAEVLPTVRRGDLWIEDRNFCTRKWLFGVAARGAHFLVREHRTNVPWEAESELQDVGRTATADVWEQRVRIVDPSTGKTLTVRRIELHLDAPTRDGERVVALLTNVSKKKATALRLAQLYRRRWTIETLFQILEKALQSEQPSLGYPSAALLGFCLALVAYNLLAVIKAALRVTHGREQVEDGVSLYYFALEMSRVYHGMMIAVPEENWQVFQKRTPLEMAQFLKEVAAHVQLRRYARQPRGPKKPPPKRTKKKNEPHVSTARLLDQRRKMKVR